MLSFISDSEPRWCSIYAMLVRYKLWASIQQYNEKVIKNKNLDKVLMWDIMAIDYPKM